MDHIFTIFPGRGAGLGFSLFPVEARAYLDVRVVVYLEIILVS